MSVKIKYPLLLILAIILILGMLRLAVWQLERAEYKQANLDLMLSRSKLASQDLRNMLNDLSVENGRYRNVSVIGHYMPAKSIYIDNQVVQGQVGYLVFTPFNLRDSDHTVMVNRGWLSVGDSREELPLFETNKHEQTLHGRLNTPPEKPPLWNDTYAVAQGKVWAYLPLSQYEAEMQLKMLPLVVELSPIENSKKGSKFKIFWQPIGDQWVAKHKGYAFQWLMMAIAFFIACCVLLLNSLRHKPKS